MEKLNNLYIGDLHLEEGSIEEIFDIKNEILEIPATHLYQLGDVCHKNKINSPELSFLTEIMCEFKKRYQSVTLLKGNHDDLDYKEAIIDYLLYLGIGIVPDELSRNNFMIGHFFIDKSKDSFGQFRYKLEDLIKVNYLFCLLGHQHDYQDLGNSIYHLGSCRYISFGEDTKLKKRVAWYHDDKLEFIELKSVIPMYNVYELKELETIPNRSKVRFIFTSFEQLKNNIKYITEMKKKFYEFKTKIDFKPITMEETKEIKPIKSNSEFVKDWLKTINDSEIRNILEKEFSTEFK